MKKLYKQYDKLALIEDFNKGMSVRLAVIKHNITQGVAQKTRQRFAVYGTPLEQAIKKMELGHSLVEIRKEYGMDVYTEALEWRSL